MEIRLKSNWAGYPPGKVLSVSAERAKYLVEKLKIANFTSAQKAINDDKKPRGNK